MIRIANGQGFWVKEQLLYNALDGGGTLSLCADPQGKTCSSALLRMEIEID